MKTKTYLMLKQELLNHEYSFDGEYDIDKLFQIYCIEEIKTITDLLRSHQEFADFVFLNQDKFNLNTNALKILLDCKVKNILRRFYRVSNKYFGNYRKDQENFVILVSRLVGDTTTSVFEVGSGEIPYSSILLAKDMKNITSIDKFGIPLETLANLNVTGINDYFGENTDISQADFIVGKQACSAIEPVVIKCGLEGKPYFMELCSCNAPSTGIISSWEDYLKKFDKNIKFKSVKTKTYAYDFGTPKPSEEAMVK